MSSREGGTLMQLNFIEYLAHEEHNLLASCNNFRTEMELFHELDNIYQEPMQRLSLPSTDQPGVVIGNLYAFVHFYLYFSVSCLLRSHLSECFGSTRKAIDAALSAYKILLEPETAAKYLARDSLFQYIKSRMVDEIKKDPSKYPLAPVLFPYHDMFSQYGAHADVSTFVYRSNLKEAQQKEQFLVNFQYFQLPDNKADYAFHFVGSLLVFVQIFKIFKEPFLDKNLKIIDPLWEASLLTIESRLRELSERRRLEEKVVVMQVQ